MITVTVIFDVWVLHLVGKKGTGQGAHPTNSMSYLV